METLIKYYDAIIPTLSRLITSEGYAWGYITGIHVYGQYGCKTVDKNLDLLVTYTYN